jgi:hypothetical protein
MLAYQGQSFSGRTLSRNDLGASVGGSLGRVTNRVCCAVSTLSCDVSTVLSRLDVRRVAQVIRG